MSKRNRFSGAQHSSLDVRRGVPVHLIVPPHPGRDQPIERVQRVDADIRVVVLVDDNRCRGMGDVDMTEPFGLLRVAGGCDSGRAARSVRL